MNKMNRMLNKIIYMKILTIPANKAQTPTINRMLKTADPTIVPTPTSLFAINTPIKKHTNFLACFPHFFSSLSITSEYQIYEVYLCNLCLSPLTLWVRIPLRRSVLDTTLCDKVCQWLVTGRWYSPGTPVSSTNKTEHHDIAEILLKGALKHHKPINQSYFCRFSLNMWLILCRKGQY